jgi:hypothetical protein
MNDPLFLSWRRMQAGFDVRSAVAETSGQCGRLITRKDSCCVAVNAVNANIVSRRQSGFWDRADIRTLETHVAEFWVFGQAALGDRGMKFVF